MHIGIIGGGMIGSTMARLWVDAGHHVCIASRHPEQLQPLADDLGPRASAGIPAEAAAYGEVVMLAVPLGATPQLARDLSKFLHDKIVMDTNNAYAERDGDAAREASAHPGGSSAWAAAMLPRARWVKAFNTVYYEVLAAEAHRGGPRVGIPLASDDVYALSVVAQLVRDAGFDPVVVGPLARGREFEPGTPPYNTGMTGEDLRRLLGVA